MLGWVSKQNPTDIGCCWVRDRLTQPTETNDDLQPKPYNAPAYCLVVNIRHRKYPEKVFNSDPAGVKTPVKN